MRKRPILTKDGWRVLFRLVLPSIFLWVAFLLGYSAMRRWLDLELHFLPIPEHVWDWFLPHVFALPFVFLTIWPLAAYLKLFKVASLPVFEVGMLHWILMPIPVMVFQSYLKVAVQPLIVLDSPAEINLDDAGRFYRFKHFEFDTSLVSEPGIYTHEFQGSQKREERVYLAIPLKHTKPTGTNLPRVWLCLRETESVSKTATPELRMRVTETVKAAGLKRLDQLTPENTGYFENLPDEEERDYFMMAISHQGAVHHPEEYILLKAYSEEFAPNLDGKMRWALFAFVGCWAFVSISLLADQVDQTAE